jgi:hypothetical protein
VDGKQGSGGIRVDPILTDVYLSYSLLPGNSLSILYRPSQGAVVARLSSQARIEKFEGHVAQDIRMEEADLGSTGMAEGAALAALASLMRLIEKTLP